LDVYSIETHIAYRATRAPTRREWELHLSAEIFGIISNRVEMIDLSSSKQVAHETLDVIGGDKPNTSQVEWPIHQEGSGVGL
jgi:hypothetical protein